MAGASVAQLKAAGISVIGLKAEGMPLKELKGAGYPLTELKMAGYTNAELRAVGFDAADIMRIGVSAQECRTSGYTCARPEPIAIHPTVRPVPSVPPTALNARGCVPVQVYGALSGGVYRARPPSVGFQRLEPPKGCLHG